MASCSLLALAFAMIVSVGFSGKEDRVDPLDGWRMTDRFSGIRFEVRYFVFGLVYACACVYMCVYVCVHQSRARVVDKHD